MRMRPLVIIPTYNEAGSIRSLITRLLDMDQYELEILVIDDGSPDGTADLVESMGKHQVHVLRRATKDGLGAAYRAGFAWAMNHTNFTHYVTMDGDGSHRPKDLRPMLARAQTYDVVLGTRWMPGGEVYDWPLARRALSRLGTAYARLALGLPFRDITGGFKVYNRKIVEQLDLNCISSEGYCFQIEMLFRAYRTGLKITESPITFVERVQGESKMSMAIVKEAIKKVSLWGLRYRLGLMRD